MMLHLARNNDTVLVRSLALARTWEAEHTPSRSDLAHVKDFKSYQGT